MRRGNLSGRVVIAPIIEAGAAIDPLTNSTATPAIDEDGRDKLVR